MQGVALPGKLLVECAAEYGRIRIYPYWKWQVFPDIYEIAHSTMTGDYRLDFARRARSGKVNYAFKWNGSI